MRPNQAPSAEMLHSVGALMDTSFLRAAVADANGSARATLAPVSIVSRFAAWVSAAIARRALPRR
ncbi:MAG: hypothetical protein Q7T55_18230 [Solirubrobacteraceae bacterium]|nr:hypothetical protein [Solirubrobacteraceae bacterium]